jgi:outer membrane protein assembly factor BamB
MKKLHIFRSTIVYAIFLILALNAVAKRISPKPAAPVVANGVRYSAEGDGRNQYISAIDISTGKELWRVKVFHTRIKPWLEEDVQWVFISDLKLIDNFIAVRDESARCYALNLKTHRVRKAPCTKVFRAQEVVSQ